MTPHIPTEIPWRIPPDQWVNPDPDTPPLEEVSEFPFSTSDLIAALVVLKLSKTDRGLKLLETLGKSFLEGTFKTLGYLAQASSANRITAFAAPILISQVLARFKFLDQSWIPVYHGSLSMIAGAGVAEAFVKAFGGWLPKIGVKEDSPYPETVVFASEPPPSVAGFLEKK